MSSCSGSDEFVVFCHAVETVDRKHSMRHVECCSPFEQASSMSSDRSDKTEAHQQKKKGCLCSCEGKGFEVLGEEHAQSRSGEAPA